MKTFTINFTIAVGDYLKLGYRPIGAPSFTYISPNLFFNQTPYTLSLPSSAVYEFELTTLCGGNDCPEPSTSVYITEGEV